MRVILPEIKELIATKKKRALRKVTSYFEPADIAEIWSEFTFDEQLVFFNALDTRIATDVFEFLKEDEMLELFARGLGKRMVAYWGTAGDLPRIVEEYAKEIRELRWVLAGLEK